MIRRVTMRVRIYMRMLHDCIWIPTLVHKCITLLRQACTVTWTKKSATITFKIVYISRRIEIRIRMEITLGKEMRMVNICKIEEKYLLSMIKKKNDRSRVKTEKSEIEEEKE